MLLYEVELPGFDGSRDRTDSLILWGYADSLSQVRDVFPRAKVRELDGTLAYPGSPDVDFQLDTLED